MHKIKKIITGNNTFRCHGRYGMFPVTIPACGWSGMLKTMLAIFPFFWVFREEINGKRISCKDLTVVKNLRVPGRHLHLSQYFSVQTNNVCTLAERLKIRTMCGIALSWLLNVENVSFCYILSPCSKSFNVCSDRLDIV